VRRGLATALLAVAAAGAGAGVGISPAGAGTRSQQPDACTLVPEAELEAAAGYALEPGDDIVTTAYASGCGFDATTPSDGPDVGILLSTAASDKVRQTFSVKTLERDLGKSTKVADLGTRARFSFEQGKIPLAGLLVVDDGAFVEVTLRGATTRREALAEATAIATLVLDALGGGAAGTTTSTQAGG
jgi:hypothetical protein